MKTLQRLISVILFSGLSLLAFAQRGSDKDSLFRLLQADEAQLMTQYNINYRIVKGNARFLHNNTYLLCDSASWNVDSRVIEAYGNVQILQNNTVLKSNELIYWIDQDLAKFRGGLVELMDKDGNILRTNQLDYNTKDSVGVYRYGGAMMDSTKNVIESRIGTYDAKQSTFTFENEVEIYMDSLMMKTDNLRYLTDTERAYFGTETYLWRDEGFLTAKSGYYDRKTGMVYFAQDVYMKDPDYEAWTQELYYDRNSGEVEMFTHSQVLDTANKSYYLGNHIHYLPDTSMAVLTRDPALVFFGENENHVVDTLYARADTIQVYSIKKCDIPQSEFDAGKKRRDDILYDALSETRAKQAEEREKTRIEKLRSVGKLPPENIDNKGVSDSLNVSKDSLNVPIGHLRAGADSLNIPMDSLIVQMDSVSVQVDSVIVVRDTTPVRHIKAWHNFKLFRSDMQAACDSVFFTEIDSIARMFGSPVLWNDIKNQLTAQEMNMLMRDGNLDRGSMITDAWLISQQDSTHFNQIKSTEMLGFFYENELYRFDALGGVNAVFYLVEDNQVSTINMKEAKSLTAMIKDGNARRLLYMETIKSDAYPVTELELDKQRLKDFKWRADERPASPQAITDQVLHQSDRETYKEIRLPKYWETDHFFNDYMNNLLSTR